MVNREKMRRILGDAVMANGTARDFATRHGIDYKGVQRLCRGRRGVTMHFMNQVADALGIPMAELVAKCEPEQKHYPHYGPGVKVPCVLNGMKCKSISEAARMAGVDRTTVLRHLVDGVGLMKTSAGYMTISYEVVGE